MSSIIENEMSDDDNKFWFYKKKNKFLHNIDTFYYSVTYLEDFSNETESHQVIKLREWLNDLAVQLDQSHDDCIQVNIPGVNDPLYYTYGSHARRYCYHLSVPEYYDFFWIAVDPNGQTAQLLIQIRSKGLWLDGVHKSFENSYHIVEQMSKYFMLHITEVKENRVDYCWHTNYITAPDKFFNIEKLYNMAVTKLQDVNQHHRFRANGIETDYTSFGVRSNPLFVRFYLKTKEVVEQGYKPWFFNIWLFNELISRYDYYILTNLYALRNWRVLDLIRLQFYLDYGQVNEYKDLIIQYMKSYFERGSCNFKSIAELADKLTPPITNIVNNEFQTLRKMSRSYCLVENPRNEKYGKAKRIYDYLDNHKLITDYLTHESFRLVEFDSGDSNKSRRDYCEYWKRLRGTKMIDCKNRTYPVKLLRDYSRSHNFELMKSRFIHSTVNLSLYGYGTNNSQNFVEDYETMLTLLNDNDIYKASQYKSKRRHQLYPADFKDVFNRAELEGIIYDDK